MTATDITFTTAETVNEQTFAALSHIEDVARITLADIDDDGADYEDVILSF